MRLAPVRLAPLRIAPLRIAPLRLVSVRLAPVRLALVRLVSVRIAPVSLAPVSLAPVRFTDFMSALLRAAKERSALRSREGFSFSRLARPVLTKKLLTCAIRALSSCRITVTVKA